MEFQSVIGVVIFEEGELVDDEKHHEIRTKYYTLYSDDDAVYPLKFETISQAISVPINRKIALSISKEPDEHGEYLVSPEDKFYSFVTSFTTASGPDEWTTEVSADTKPQVKIALFRSVNPGTLENRGGVEGDWYADEWRKVRYAAHDIWAWYTQLMGHINDYEVRGYCVITTKTAGRSYYLEDVISEHKKLDDKIFGQENTWKEEFYHSTDNPNGYNYKWYHAWSGASTNICGWGQVGRPGSMTYQSCSKGSGTMIHELGHNFGLRHSQTVTGNETDGYTVSEYGDTSCRMGKGVSGFNSYQFHKIGGLLDHQVGTPQSSESFVVVPIELSEHAMHPGEVKAVSKGHWMFSTRDYSTNPYGGGSSSTGKKMGTSKIYHHTYQYPGLPDSTGIAAGDNRGKTQSWGQRAERDIGSGKILIDDDLAVSNEHDTFTKRVLKYVADGGEVPADPEITMGFPQQVPGVSLEEWHSGLWYNPDMDGQGFDIDIHNGRMVLAWYTYGNWPISGINAAQQKYYIASCPLTEGLEEFDLVTTDGGTFENPSQRTERVAGKGQIYFFNETQGVFLYDTEDHGYGAVEITRLLEPSKDDRNGFWFDPERNGEGMSTNIIAPKTTANPSDVPRINAFLYTYDRSVVDHVGRAQKDSTQRWFLLDGLLDKDEKGEFFDCKVWQPWKGLVLTGMKKYTNEIVGTAKLRFDQTGNCWVSVDYKDRCNERSQQRKKNIKMQRLF